MGTYQNNNATNNNNGDGKKERTITITTNQGAKEIPESSRIEFEPVVFECFGKTTRIKASELSRMIRAQFQKKFHDCIGANIIYNGQQFDVLLFFQNNDKPIEDGKFKNLINLQTVEGVKKTSIYDLNQVANRKKNGQTFTLNDETKLFLSDFMYGGRNANPVNDKGRWSKYLFERRTPASTMMYQYGAENIITAVTGLDIKVICRKLYGNIMITSTGYDENGTPYNVQTKNAYYELRYGKPLGSGDFMINIEQFDRDKVEELNQIENPQIIQSSGVQMY